MFLMKPRWIRVDPKLRASAAATAPAITTFLGDSKSFSPSIDRVGVSNVHWWRKDVVRVPSSFGGAFGDQGSEAI